MADIYDEAAGSRAGGKGNYVTDRPGNYELLVEKVYERDSTTNRDGSRNPKGGFSIIAEFLVLKSSPNGEKDDKGVPYEPWPPGASVCYVMSDKGNGGVMQPINYKTMVLGVLEGRGATEDKIDSKVLRGVTSKENPLRGHRVECATVLTQTRETKKWIRIPKWQGIAQTKEQVVSARGKLDARAVQVEKPSAPAAPPTQPVATPEQRAAASPPPAELPPPPKESPKAEPAADTSGSFLDMI